MKQRLLRGLYELALHVAWMVLWCVGFLPIFLLVVFMVAPGGKALAWLIIPTVAFFFAWAWFWHIRVERVRLRYFPKSWLAVDPEAVGISREEVGRGAEVRDDYRSSDPPPRPDAKARYLRRLRAIADQRPFDGA